MAVDMVVERAVEARAAEEEAMEAAEAMERTAVSSLERTHDFSVSPLRSLLADGPSRSHRLKSSLLAMFTPEYILL